MKEAHDLHPSDRFVLGGTSWGPVISQQDYEDQNSCNSAKNHVLSAVKEMDKTNLIGNSARERIRAVVVNTPTDLKRIGYECTF